MKSMNLIGYIRVSTARQGEGFSLKAQKEAITRYCKTYKHKLIAIEAESKSAIRERPVFEKLFQRLIAPNSNLDGLIVAKLDRLGRSVKDLADIAAELHQHKKQLISVADNIDTSTPMASCCFTFYRPSLNTSGSCSLNAPRPDEPWQRKRARSVTGHASL
jgi:DNA invertase Pin-like site-specific DNA recombinase